MLNDSLFHGRLRQFGFSQTVNTQAEATASRSRYAHILVPIDSAGEDLSALKLGAEFAAVHRARLTLLQVLPEVERGTSVHWLNAIDRLYEGLDANGLDAKFQAREARDKAQVRVTELFDQSVSAYLRDTVDVHVEIRTGDIADAAVAFSEQADVDLIILADARSRRWWPLWPTPIRKILRVARPEVILMRSHTQQVR